MYSYTTNISRQFVNTYINDQRLVYMSPLLFVIMPSLDLQYTINYYAVKYLYTINYMSVCSLFFNTLTCYSLTPLFKFEAVVIVW